jgi:cytochrome P450 family 619
VYGIRSPSIDAPWTQKLNDIVELWARITEFGATPPVDLFPFLKLVPQRFLGNWVTRSNTVHDKVHALYGGLLQSVKERRRTTGAVDCIADRLLEQEEKHGLSDHNVMLLAGVTLKGGSDTSASTLTSWMQAMVLYPEVQRKAQAEIDAVVGDKRIPTWSDYRDMPYLATMVKEAMRWRPTAPLGFPHALSEGGLPPQRVVLLKPTVCVHPLTFRHSDQWIDGKFLPKGTVLFVNVYGLHQDETKFPNPNTFDPDHYKGRTLLAAEYANSADYENRDHYGFGTSHPSCLPWT